MKKTLFLLLIAFSLVTHARTEICPEQAPSEVVPKVSVKVKFDNKTSQYKYMYRVTNLPEAKVPIWKFSIESDDKPVATGFPAGWSTPVVDKKNREIVWTYNAALNKPAYIRPGKTLAGFEIVSKKAPGTVRAYVDGDVADIPIVKFENDEAEVDPDAIICPGFFNSQGNLSNVAFSTKGPALTNRVEARMRIRKSDGKIWLGSPNAPPDLKFSPLDYGQIDVMIFGSKAVDVNKIDLSTLKFGPGQADHNPVKKAIIEKFKDVSDEEIFAHVQKTKAPHLLLSFNLQDVDIRCNLDRALFLTAKIGGQDLFGTVNIEPVECDGETFAREAKKPIYKKSKETVIEDK